MYIDSELINNVYKMFFTIFSTLYSFFSLILFTLFILNIILAYYYNIYIFVYILLSFIIFIYSNCLLLSGNIDYAINSINNYGKKIMSLFILYLTYTMISIKYCEDIKVNPEDYENKNEYLLHTNRIKSLCITIYMTFVFEIMFVGFVFYALNKGEIEQQPVPVPQIEPIPNITIIIDKQECAVCYNEKERFGDICKCNQKTCEECLKKCNRVCPTCRQPF